MTKRAGLKGVGRLGVLAVTLIVALSGCGAQGPSPQAKAAASKSAAAEQAAKDRQVKAQKQRAHETAIYQECKKAMGPLDNSLSDLNSRLSVGLQFADYGVRVGASRSVYDKAVKDAKAGGGISSPCINRVATPLENALQAFVDAYNVWNKCTQDYNCDISKGDANTKTQAAWSKGGNLIDKADTALTKLQPSS